MKIALAQINPTVGDFPGNSAKILATAEQALLRGAELAVFSELCLCGYLPQDLLERPAFLERNRTELARLAQKLPLPAIIGYAGRAHESTGKPVANSAALLDGGQIVFEQQKMLLPTYDVFDENRYFQPAKEQFVFPLSTNRLGITICEDIWNDKNFWTKRLYERDPVAELVSKGAQIIINLSASPYTIDKRNLRTDMLRALARQHARPVVYVNQVGGDDSLIFDGSSLAVMPDGRIAAQAQSFEEDLVLFDSATGQGDIRSQPVEEIETAYTALVCGTRDYVAKCGFRNLAIGLSGGIDSALVAVIAVDAVGPDHVLGVAMPGPYSSPGSVTDARQLAANLGIKLIELPIGDVFESYLHSLGPAFADRPVDVTEENIQARIRGNYLMALSNKFGSLVLSTGNKSEMAIGYCTLYGDMAGGLAVISDVPKTMVYELAYFINRRNKSREVIPAAILTKPPSAELRPNQTDQDSLPPYETLDCILKAYIEEVRSPEEIADHYGYAPELVRSVAQRVDRAEYKRKQAPPGLKLTSRAFGFGRPFPIAQKFQP
ncbi:MAG TPA: NAD+ synthase [Candidatus Acidoferrales bacterium]|jgi:NAD+ synthetase|nr:NAD+ synthase [Candidatus Acidoferrales bacterium]